VTGQEAAGALISFSTDPSFSPARLRPAPPRTALKCARCTVHPTSRAAPATLHANLPSSRNDGTRGAAGGYGQQARPLAAKVSALPFQHPSTSAHPPPDAECCARSSQLAARSSALPRSRPTCSTRLGAARWASSLPPPCRRRLVDPRPTALCSAVPCAFLSARPFLCARASTLSGGRMQSLWRIQFRRRSSAPALASMRVLDGRPAPASSDVVHGAPLLTHPTQCATSAVSCSPEAPPWAC
jgi:hypothetical protein